MLSLTRGSTATSVGSLDPSTRRQGSDCGVCPWSGTASPSQGLQPAWLQGMPPSRSRRRLRLNPRRWSHQASRRESAGKAIQDLIAWLTGTEIFHARCVFLIQSCDEGLKSTSRSLQLTGLSSHIVPMNSDCDLRQGVTPLWSMSK